MHALSTLNYYLSLNEQDPEWVNWVQRELSERTPDAELAQRIYGFISLEERSLTRNAVIETFKHFYYSSGAYPPVKAYILDSCVRSTLEQLNIEFDGPALESALRSMRIDQENSTFFRSVIDGSQLQIKLNPRKTLHRLVSQRLLYLPLPLSYMIGG